MLTLYPDGRLTGFAKATKTSGTAKVYWRPLNSKRSLPVLEWTSESEYFERFKKNFADNNNTGQEQSLYPFAAHAQRGVKMDASAGLDVEGGSDGVITPPLTLIIYL